MTFVGICQEKGSLQKVFLEIFFIFLFEKVYPAKHCKIDFGANAWFRPIGAHEATLLLHATVLAGMDAGFLGVQARLWRTAQKDRYCEWSLRTFPRRPC